MIDLFGSLFGVLFWPSVALAMALALWGVARGRRPLVLAAVVVSMPATVYLIGYPSLRGVAMLPTLALLGAAVALGHERRELAAVLVVPLLVLWGYVAWLAADLPVDDPPNAVSPAEPNAPGTSSEHPGEGPHPSSRPETAADRREALETASPGARSTPTAPAGSSVPPAATIDAASATAAPNAAAADGASATSTVAPTHTATAVLARGAASATTAPARPLPLPPEVLPGTLAGVHFADPSVAASDVFGEGLRGWAVEVAYAVDQSWHGSTAERLRTLHDAGYVPILRLDYDRGQAIPPAGEWEAKGVYLRALARILDEAAGTVRVVVVGNELNIDAAGDAPDRHTECRAGRDGCEPAAYADLYSRVQAHLAQRGGPKVWALVAAPSPGTDAHPSRWMDGPAWLEQTLRLLPPRAVDGVALHAYGDEETRVPELPRGPLPYFQALVERQLQAMRAAGHGGTPIFITEMNAYEDPDPAFVEPALRWLAGRAVAGDPPVLAACWFTWSAHGAWAHVALERQPEVAAALRRAAEATRLR